MLQTVETVRHPFTTGSNVKRILINDEWVRAASGKTFGGYKMSGYGRESGIQQMEEYLNVKAVWIKTA